MNIRINRILSFAALAGLIGAATSLAGVQAKFHLPVTAHWGQAILAPGDYELSVKESSSGIKNVVIQGEGRTVFALSLSADEGLEAHSSSIELVERNGAFFVEKYNSDVAGKTYSFAVPKVKGQLEAKRMDVATY